MLVEIEYKGMVRLTDGDIVIVWQEKSGTRYCPIFFSKEFLPWMFAALNKTAPRGIYVAHCALIQFILEDLGTVVSKLTVPDYYRSADDDVESYKMLIHFRTPAGMIEREFLPGDAVTIALFSECPVFISPAVLDIVTDDGVKYAALLDHQEVPKSDLEKASDAAQAPSDDDLPKA